MKRVTALLLLLSCLPIPAAAAPEAEVVVRATRGQFEDVRNSVVFAIEGRGLVVTNTAHVGEMLDRTGRDLGTARQVFSRAEVLEFCSATMSRQMMEADPHTIVYCPYAIAVYELPGQPGRIHVSYRRPLAAAGGKAAKALEALERLLSDIVREALQ